MPCASWSAGAIVRSPWLETAPLRGAGCAALLALLAAVWVSGCSLQHRTREPAVDPDAVRADIAARLPKGTTHAEGWAIDIFAAFEALHIAPTTQNTCAVIAVAQQESGLQANPLVPGLAGIARKEIEERAS